MQETLLAHMLEEQSEVSSYSKKKWRITLNWKG
jgi:hypothetical protein